MAPNRPRDGGPARPSSRPSFQPSFRPWEILSPREQASPLVLASPHSGRAYPKAFIAASRLDAPTLRRTEDAYMDRLVAGAPGLGVPLLKAHFPRAYVDPNREAFELDPAMFDGPLPAYVNTRSSRVAAGLGTIARVVGSGEDIYSGKLDFAEVRKRIESCHLSYHRALKELLDQTRRRFGACLLIDCHSMPSVGGPLDRDPGLKRVDVVLGDRHGTSAAAVVTDTAARALEDQGLAVTRNTPYAGGFTTRHYGDPGRGVHVLQIEVNRALYLDEVNVAPGPGLPALAEKMNRLIDALKDIGAEVLAPPTATPTSIPWAAQ